MHVSTEDQVDAELFRHLQDLLVIAQAVEIRIARAVLHPNAVVHREDVHASVELADSSFYVVDLVCGQEPGGVVRPARPDVLDRYDRDLILIGADERVLLWSVAFAANPGRKVSFEGAAGEIGACWSSGRAVAS